MAIEKKKGRDQLLAMSQDLRVIAPDVAEVIRLIAAEAEKPEPNSEHIHRLFQQIPTGRIAGNNVLSTVTEVVRAMGGFMEDGGA